MSKGNGQFEAWAELEHAVRTGTPSLNKVFGYDLWESGRRNPEARMLFDKSMKSASEAMTPAATAAYDWSQFPVIVDVGGDRGTQLVSILDAFPSSSGILFDQPHVVVESIPHDRIEIVGGDFFISVPADADAYVLRWILHDWPDAKAKLILKSLRRASKPTAHPILMEMIISEGPGFDSGKWTDPQMLALVGGGERTEQEFRSLLSASGFELEVVRTTATPMNLVVTKPINQ